MSLVASRDNTAELQCFALTFLTGSPGEPAGARVLLDVLGSAAGLQSLLGAGRLWRGPGHHAHRRPHLLPGRPLEGKTKVYLPLHRSVAAWVGGRAGGRAGLGVLADSVCCVSCRESDAAGPESLLCGLPSAGPRGGCCSVRMDRAVLRPEQFVRQLLRTLCPRCARQLSLFFLL